MSSEKKDTALSPSAIVNIFNNALSIDAIRKIVSVKGVYSAGKGSNYGGVFYDQIKDELSDAFITLVVPGIIRSQLEDQETIEINGYITKRVQPLGARIELHLHVVEILSQQDAKYSDDQLVVPLWMGD